jgi:16S rRNA (guanine966-N2)-methyltransferase
LTAGKAVLKSNHLPRSGEEIFLRVISGTLKGKKLFSVKGQSLRPTSDRVKEAIFDILQDRFRGQKVLDLFAGTGALGIEALSRGATTAVFVEESPRSLSALRRNIEACRLQDRATVLVKEVPIGLKILEEKGERFGLILLDPPYGKGWAARTLAALSRCSILDADGLVVAEHSVTEELPSAPFLKRVDGRRYGDTQVSFFRPDPNPPEFNKK